MSLPACQSSQASPPPSLANAAADSRSALSIQARLAMVGHPVRHRLGLVDASVPGHQQEEGDVKRPKDARCDHVGALSRLQTEIADPDERDDGCAEEELEQPAAITDRFDLRAIEPRQEEEEEYRRAHERGAGQLVRNGTQN